MRVRGSFVALMVVVGMSGFGLAAAHAAPGGQPGPADQAAPQATLVRTDVFLPAPDRNPGRPAPATANCSNDDPSAYLSAPAFTGAVVSPTSDLVARFNSATTPASMTSEQARQAFQAAFDAWSDNSSAPAFTVQSMTTGVVTKATANHHTDVLFGRTSGNALAVTYTWHWSDGTYESDTVMNSNVSWTNISGNTDGCAETTVAYDVQNIATHEFGHIYGLGHPANDRYATMYAYGYTGETLKRTLATSDQNGINQLY